jgi:uncharacterized membrane protein YqaE (UPF0057 family)
LRYLLALLLPPLGMLLCGKVFQAILCLVLMLTVIGWPVASIWALLVVHSHLEDQRADRIIRAMRDRG